MKKMKTNRRITDNGVHIVHEGLQNHKDVKDKLIKIANDLISCAWNETSHLSDVALVVQFRAEEMLEISKDLFERHKKEKKDGV